MNNRFSGRVAVVTGGAEGLGKSIAYRIAREGGKVVLLDINEELLQSSVAFFKREKLCAVGYKVDISNEEEVKAGFDKVISAENRVDIMVNAAGIVGPTGTAIINYPTSEFDKLYSINLRGSFLTTKYAVMAMKRNNYGRILLLASIAGKEGNPNMVGYSAMKAGVIGLVKSVGKEFAETGISINGLAPAVIKTAMNEKTDPEQLSYMVAKIPMGRLGTLEETAAISCWIVSEEASFTTGFVFDLSGGRATY